MSLALLAFTSAVDAALTAISRHRLGLIQEEDRPRAAIVGRLLDDPYRFKVAILLLNTAAVIAATALTTYLTRALAWGWRLGALALLLVAIMVFSEGLPKALALRDPAAAARLLAGPMAFGTRVIWPLAWLIGVIAAPVVRLLSGAPASPTPLVTEEELRMLVNVGEEEGLIEPDEREMIEGIFTFGDTLVREVMIPRVDIVCLEDTATLDEALDTIIARGHSRIPVYHESIDQIVGILYAKDLLPWMRAGKRDVGLTALLRAAHFVPESMKVDALLKDLQARKVHLAIAVDEYGGTAGLVTIEDALEEIVGEIQDEYDIELPPVQVVGEGELIVDARVLIDDINDLTGLALESQESDRIGGVVFEQLGRVPQQGDEVHLPGGVTIRVLAVEGLRPRRLQLSYRAEDALALSVPRGERAGARPAQGEHSGERQDEGGGGR
ncbi:MAG TPA: hemolysin family protein [Roseiflexaceae bacterium]|nr:hemolysin family protein [Roseiflexaceae bacterium]